MPVAYLTRVTEAVARPVTRVFGDPVLGEPMLGKECPEQDFPWPPVRCNARILLEIPSSAYSYGLLALINNREKEEETAGDYTPSNTSFMVASISSSAT